MIQGGFSGDWHYGLSVEELDRTPDVDKAVSHVIDEVIERELDFFSMGGDATDNNTPSDESKRMLIRQLNRLEDAEIPTFFMKGNHDAVSIAGRMWGLSSLEEIGYNNIHFITEPKVIAYEGMRFLFLPHTTKAQALEAGFTSAQDFINAEAERLVEETEAPITVISHYNVDGAMAGTEALMLRQTDLQLPGIVRRSPKVTAIFNSHIHTAQMDGKMFHPGSPLCTDFGDLEHQKGFMIGNFDEKGEWQSTEFIDTPQSPMQEFELDLRGMEQKEIISEIESAEGDVMADAIVKIRVMIEEENLPLVDFQKLKECFERHCRFVKNVDRVVMRKRQVRDSDQTPDLSPIEAVKRYIDSRKPQGAKRKLQLALDMIEGNEPEVQDQEGQFMNETAAKDSLDESLEALDTELPDFEGPGFDNTEEIKFYDEEEPNVDKPSTDFDSELSLPGM